jgi:hypothetical protein
MRALRDDTQFEAFDRSILELLAVSQGSLDFGLGVLENGLVKLVGRREPRETL